MQYLARPMSDDDVAAIVELCGRHEWSVIRRLAGLPVRGKAGEAVDKAIAAFFEAKNEREAT